MNLFRVILTLLFFLLPQSLMGIVVILEDQSTQTIAPSTIVRVDLALKNELSNPVDILSKVETDPYFQLLLKYPKIELDSKETRKISYYFKIEPNITAGIHPVTFKFNENGKITTTKKLFSVAPKTRVFFNKVIYNDITSILEVTNNSNHPVIILNQQIPPKGKKNLSYKFHNKTANNFYTDKIPVFYDEKKVSEITVFCKTSSSMFIAKNDEEFLFPINYGFAFSNNKSHKSLTVYAKGGGQFSRDQALEFSFSAPFYGGGLDPYLYYEPETALFYIYYRYKTLFLKAGDSYFQNNPYLYYRYGRGYVFGYNNKENFQTSLGYVTKNQFYKNPEKDLIFSVEKTTNPKIYYNSFYEFDHYNQNLGIGYQSGDPNEGLKADLQFFNTDFELKNEHSGILGSISFRNPVFSTSILADYIGNQFRGRTNAESRLVGDLRGKIRQFNFSTALKGSYSRLFPYNDTEVKTTNYSASISKKIGKTYNGLTFDYLDYVQEDLERKNYSFYYSFSRPFGSDYYLSFDQGITYSDFLYGPTGETFKTYTRINGSFHRDRWSLNTGIYSQVRYFSESTNQQNSLFFGTTYRYQNSKAYINFTFSNGTFSYKPSINVNYSTKYKILDLELDYTLTPSFKGYDWRALAKFNILQYLHFKKPTDMRTVVFDKNTKKPIDHLLLKSSNRKKVEVIDGKINGEFSEEELKALTFSSMDLERKFTKKTHPDSIEKEFVFELDYRVKVLGQLDFRPRYGHRDSIDRLILNQRAYARSEEGKYYYGLIDKDGSFIIPGLPVGRYKVGVNQYKLPRNVNIEEKLIVVDYTSQDVETELIVSY